MFVAFYLDVKLRVEPERNLIRFAIDKTHEGTLRLHLDA